MSRYHSFDVEIDPVDNICLEVDQRAPKFPIEAGETLQYNDLIGISMGGRALRAQDGVLKCIGFCATEAGAVEGQIIEVRFGGLYYPNSVLAPGDIYYTSDVAGSVGNLATAPTWGQAIGMAISETAILFRPEL